MIRKTFFSFLSLCVTGGFVWAQDEVRQGTPVSSGVINDVDEATVRMHPATPFMERSSLVLVDVDLTKINVDAMLAWLQQSLGFGEIPARMQATGAAANGFLTTLKAAGADRLYVGASTRSFFDRGPIVVIPCDDTAAVKALASAALQGVPADLNLTTHVGDGLVLIGPAATVQRVLDAEDIERADLILPTKLQSLDHSLVISLPKEAREDLVALWPESMPAEFPLQFSPRALADDVRRFVISWRLPPEPAINVRIECEEMKSAVRVSGLLDRAKALVPQLNGLMEVKVDKSIVNLTAEPQAFAKMLGAVTSSTRDQARRMAKSNQLKNLGLAMHNYHSVKKHLPPRHFVDRDKNPLLSWRVALLPFLNQKALYDSIELGQAFNSKANQQVKDTVVPLFDSGVAELPLTTFRAPVFPGSAWHGDGPPKRFRDVTDGLSNTIAFIDAPLGDAVNWADPAPWVINETDPLGDIFGDRNEITVVIMDGSVRVFTREELTNGKLEAMLTIAGGEVIE